MKKIVYAVLAWSPLLALAQSSPVVSNLNTFLGTLKPLIQTIISIMFALGIVYFFWGLVKFIMNVSSDPKAADAGKSMMIWGIVALVVMVGIYGLINFLLGATVGTGGGSTPELPKIN